MQPLPLIQTNFNLKPFWLKSIHVNSSVFNVYCRSVTELCQLLCKRPDLTLRTIPIKQSRSVFTPQIKCHHRGFLPSVCIHDPYFFQDLMEFLNANGTECAVVLFFTTWCQFSAGLAPHFNALPRVFPSMHFLALDASQHSR